MMKKPTFIANVAGRAEVPKATVEKVFNAVIDELKEIFITDNEISFPGFGKFYVRHSKEKQGHNPSTGEPMTIPAQRAPAFKPSKVFKEEMN